MTYATTPYRGEVPAGRSDVPVDAVHGAEPPSGSVFAWLAGEPGAVRALRRHGAAPPWT